MPPMSDRWFFFLESMNEAARTVSIIWLLAHAILIARWSIRYIPLSMRRYALNLFDAWLIAVNLYLFVTA